MNNIIIQDFSQNLRRNTEELVNMLSIHPLDTKDTLLKIKTLRESILHLNNYVKIQDHLDNKNFKMNKKVEYLDVF
jgi:hypothetical protein